MIVSGLGYPRLVVPSEILADIGPVHLPQARAVQFMLFNLVHALKWHPSKFSTARR